MHITILTIGSRGDVQPFAALGNGLQAAGYQVRVATHGRFADFVRAHQLDFAPIHSDPRAMLQTEAGRAWLDSDRNLAALVLNMVRLGKPIFEQLTREAETACAGSDAIIYSLFGSVAYHLGEKWRIPAVMAHLQPVLGRTAAFPVPGSPRWPSRIPLLGRAYNWLTHWIVEQIFWQPFRPLINGWRQRDLGLPPVSFWGPYRRLYRRKVPQLYAFSPTVVSRPSRWPPWYHVTGYWFLDPPDTWQPPQEIVDFLQAGPPPVYVGFGSMTDRDPVELTEIVVQALQLARQRGILLTGWAGLDTRPLPDNILAVESVPHAWLFKRMSAVVHHGGAGTTAAGLRAGVPTLVVPYFADQHFWGAHIQRLGVGPKPLARADLTAERLAAALSRISRDEPMRLRAAGIGRLIRAEAGVAQAVEALNRYFSRLA